MEAYHLLSEEYEASEVYMQSTNVNRTLQSGYSELMGLYPPGKGERLSPEQAKAVSTFSAPPFRVRDADKINHELKDAALPDYYVQIPITQYNNFDINDDVSTDGCTYINAVGKAIEANATYWEQFDWMQKQTEKPLEKTLNKTQEEIDNVGTWHDYQMLTDTVVAMDFEGYHVHEENFSDDQWELLNQYQHIWLIDDYTKYANELMMSRMLRKPLDIMKRKVAFMLGKEVEEETNHATEDEAKNLKFFIASAHDTQVVNMMGFLRKDFDFTPYASTVMFELKYSEECLAGEDADENCFGVSVIFNGRKQIFEEFGCTGDFFTIEGCLFPEFLDYMGEIWFSGPQAPDLDAACDNPVDPFNE